MPEKLWTTDMDLTINEKKLGSCDIEKNRYTDIEEKNIDNIDYIELCKWENVI
jgi:hypothetical protein